MNDAAGQTGESDKNFTEAAKDAAYKLEQRLGHDGAVGDYKVTNLEVEIRHESPAHIQVYKVTLEKKPGTG